MSKEETLDSPIDNLDSNKRRRDLLPWWIKIFCWLFMIIGVIAIVSLFLGFTTIKPDLSIYGFETNEPFSLIGLLITGVIIFKGVTAYYLWIEKGEAILLGKIDAIMGIAICSIAMLILPFLKNGITLTIRLELLLLIPYLIILNKIDKNWNSITK